MYCHPFILVLLSHFSDFQQRPLCFEGLCCCYSLALLHLNCAHMQHFLYILGVYGLP